MKQHENSFLLTITHAKQIKSKYLFKVDICLDILLLAEVLEVDVVEVHEGVQEGSDQHGTILEQFLIQNCTCKMDEKLIFVNISITC